MELLMPQPETGAHNWAEVSRRLQRCAVALTGSRDAAEDLAQETFAVLLAKQPDKADHFGYARTTMMRLWLDRQRSARRRLARHVKLALTRGRPQRDRDRIGEAEQVARIRAAVATLPPQQHAALVLRVIEGLTYTQAADVMGCSVASLRSSLHLARARVRKTLGES